MILYNKFQNLLTECEHYQQFNEDSQSASHQKLPGETVEKPKPQFIKDLIGNDITQDSNKISADKPMPYPLTKNHLERLADVYYIMTTLKSEVSQTRNNATIKSNDSRDKTITTIIKRFEYIQDQIKNISNDLDGLE
jgi:hypothetical protein